VRVDTIFNAAVHKHQGDKHAKGMSCWGQFIALMFCHLGRGESLREIAGGLAASEGKLKHLGLDRAPARATLAYANEHRPWQIYRKRQSKPSIQEGQQVLKWKDEREGNRRQKATSSKPSRRGQTSGGI